MANGCIRSRSSLSATEFPSLWPRWERAWTPHCPSSETTGAGGAPSGLLQEYLNASGAALWGVASDGLSLRIARDNASLTRPAWIEADLARIFTEDLYPDFAALWLLAHESRFGRADDPPESCPLEVWREAGRQEGTRARGQVE